MASIAGTQSTQPNQIGIVSFAPKSSFIALFEYDKQNLTLTTHLMSGAIYQHKFVTPIDFESLKTSQNHGKHWSNQIKGKKLSVPIKRSKAPKSELKRRKNGETNKGSIG